MRLDRITFDNGGRSFSVEAGGNRYALPYVRARIPADDEVVAAHPDAELGHEAFSYTLATGTESPVHLDEVLEYHHDATYLRDMLLYRMTLEAQRAVAATVLSKRYIISRLGISAAGLHRLLDTTDYQKSVDGMLRLLLVLGSEVDVVVRHRAHG